jgi:surface protein
MVGMFGACTGLTTLDISNFDMSSVEDAEIMLALCINLNTVYTPYNIKTASELPVDDGDVWYRSDGTAVTELPQNLTSSVALGRNFTPTEKIKVTTKNSTIALSKTSFVYSGKANVPTVTITDKSGKTLKEGEDYQVTCKNNIKVGKATVSIRFMGDYTGTITKTFTIVPKATTISKVTSSKTKTLTVKWAKQANQTLGYQIQYSTSSKFTKGTTSKVNVTVKSGNITTTISKLTAKKKYYVRIRTYSKVDGTYYYSALSKATAVTTK